MVSSRASEETRVTLRLPSELHLRLRERAQTAGVSINQTIVAALDASLAGAEARTADLDSVAGRARHIRAALGDLVVELGDTGMPEHLKLMGEEFDREAFLRSLPVMDPPLPATIIDEREDRV